MECQKFRSNERVPKSGVYQVNHHLHRLVHEATLLVNEKFPSCRTCGNAVIFSLIRPVDDELVRPFTSGTILKCGSS
jgi:hypothetical protein